MSKRDPKIQRVIETSHAKWAAEDAHFAAVAEAFPAGSTITWKRRGYSQHGEVLWTGRDAITVRNFDTDKEYRIYAYDVIGSDMAKGRS